MRVKSMVKCLDCKNLIRVYLDSAFAWFGEKRIRKVKNTALDEYYEVEKERECKDHATS
jgi:hypothetical protein